LSGSSSAARRRRLLLYVELLFVGVFAAHLVLLVVDIFAFPRSGLP